MVHGQSIILISYHKASFVEKLINPQPLSLLSPIRKVMPVDGEMIAGVTFEKQSTNEFVAVDELFPDVMIGLKILCDKKCQVNIENETLTIRKRDQAGTTVPLYEGDRLEPLTDKRACVLQAEAKIEIPDVSRGVLSKNYEDVEKNVELAASELQASKTKKAE